MVIIKDRPLQLWDLKNLTVLREMPSNFSSVTALVCNSQPGKLVLVVEFLM